MSARYISIANQLRNLILENTIPDRKLPTEEALCKRYNVSRQTIRKSLSVLQEESLIEKRQGSGTYIVGHHDSSESNTIALLVTSDSEYIYPSFISELKSRLQNLNYSLSVYVTNQQLGKERSILEELLSLPVKAVISEGVKSLYPTANGDLYARLQARKVSVLFFNSLSSDLAEYPCVQAENFDGGYYLCQYLAGYRHKNIAGIFQSDDKAGIDRYHGFITALRDFNLPMRENQFCFYTYEDLAGLHSRQDTGFLSEMITKQLKFCSAVICQNDEIAYWLLKELKYADISVPQQLSIVCFHSSYLSELSSVPLTALTHKSHELADTIVDRLKKLISGAAVSSARLSFHLIERGSVSSPTNL